MKSVPLTIERCEELLKKKIFFKKECPGLVAGWRFYQIKQLDKAKKTIILEPMDNSFCPNWNPLGRVKQNIDDVKEIKKELRKRRDNDINMDKDEKPKTKNRKRKSPPVDKSPVKKRRRRDK